MPDLDLLLDGLRQGDRRALARLLTRAAHGEALPSLPAPPRPSRVVAITGSGGVGKSSLVGKLIELLRGKGLKVAVLACDPQSPLSGGALLGDRFRMPSRPDDGLFIRSLAAPSGRGAFADHLPVMIRLLESFGFDVVLIETVGSGQGDTAVHDLADVVVLLLQPETGDDLQWEKAGVLEVANIVVIHKSDLPGAEEMEAQVRAALGLPGMRAVPVLRVSARMGAGLEELWHTIEACERRRDTAELARRGLLRLAQDMLARRFDAAAAGNALAQVMQDWRAGRLPDAQAAAAVLQLLSSY
jgi:LAO/AO transport system ATPase